MPLPLTFVAVEVTRLEIVHNTKIIIVKLHSNFPAAGSAGCGLPYFHGMREECFSKGLEVRGHQNLYAGNDGSESLVARSGLFGGDVIGEVVLVVSRHGICSLGEIVLEI